MSFRPCIDLHDGKVKQVVGGSLEGGTGPTTHFVSENPPSFFAKIYQGDGLDGGHVISLGAGNEHAAREALGAWPGGLHYGGGVTPENAKTWLDHGASSVIVTSYLFDGPHFSFDKLKRMADLVGASHLVVDLSCREIDGHFVVMRDRWKTTTDLVLTPQRLREISNYCHEFLIHAVDQEGLQSGVHQGLVGFLAEHTPIPCVYAGGIHHLEEIDRLEKNGRGLVHYTVGSALDLYGGKAIRYADLVQRYRNKAMPPL